MLAVSIACGGVTAPILMLHFQAAPLFTVASNAVAGFVVAPLLGLALISTALAPVLPEAALAIGWVNGWLAAYLAGCARFFGSLPHAQLTSWKALAALAALALFAFLLSRLPPPRGRRAAVLVAMLAVVLCGWRLRPDHPPPPPQGLRIVMLDVGQGDGILLQTRAGAVLVDEGPPEAGVATQLRALGVRRLAALVVTHPHRDHVGGAADVVDSLPVGFVLDPLEPTDSPDEAALEREAREPRRANRARSRRRAVPARRATASAFSGPTDPASPARTRTSTASFCSRAMGSSTRSSPETRNRR